MFFKITTVGLIAIEKLELRKHAILSCLYASSRSCIVSFGFKLIRNSHKKLEKTVQSTIFSYLTVTFLRYKN